MCLYQCGLHSSKLVKTHYNLWYRLKNIYKVLVGIYYCLQREPMNSDNRNIKKATQRVEMKLNVILLNIL